MAGDRLTRRQAFAAGAAAGGMMLGAACGGDRGNETAQTPPATTEPAEKGPGREPFWEPGPDKNLTRDLTPGTTPIRLGTGLGRGKDETLTDMVKRIRDNGFRGVATGPKPWDSLKDSELSELRAALKEFDVVVYELAGYRNMIHPDPATRKEQLAYLAHCVETAEKLDCPMVGTITGSCDPVNGFNVHPDNWTKETWDLTVESIRQVLKDTAGMKAALGMEAQVTTNLDSPVAHKRLMEDVGDPRCAVNLDPVNMISLSNYYHTTELTNECFDLLGETILGCHAKDTYIWPDKQTVHVQEVPVGDGIFDYEMYLVRLSRMDWPRTLLPEHAPHEDLIRAGENVRKVAARIGVTIM